MKRLETYRAAWWIRGAHLQTLWGKLTRRPPTASTRTIRLDTPDGDFLDLIRLDAPSREAPRLLLLHGLEGTGRSHYVRGTLAEAARHGWGMDVLVFRSCGPESNRLPRSYHSGDTGDLAFVLACVLDEFPHASIGLAGVSLGGNVLLKWLGETGSRVPPRVRAATAVSVPFDLARSVRHIAQGFSRVYEAHFLRSLRRKAYAKLARFPGMFDDDALARARSLYDFDDVVTAPVHGFAGADDYYARASSLRYLDRIRLPTLLLSAIDDPFLPAAVLDEVRAIAARTPALKLEFVPHGGHAGFVTGRAPWRAGYYAERRIADFFAAHLTG